MKYDAAIFDMDGLLLDSERICMDCFLEAGRQIGYKVDLDVYISCIGSNEHLTKKKLITGHDVLFPYDEIYHLWRELYNNEVYEKPVPLKPGVRELLSKLSYSGIPAGVATSTAQKLAITKLTNAGLYDYFSFVVGGDQVSASKPSPDIYLKSAHKHQVNVSQCIAFEDSENGVLAAYNAGISVIQVPDLVPATIELKSLGHKIVDSLHDIDLFD